MAAPSILRQWWQLLLKPALSLKCQTTLRWQPSIAAAEGVVEVAVEITPIAVDVEEEQIEAAAEDLLLKIKIRRIKIVPASHTRRGRSIRTYRPMPAGRAPSIGRKVPALLIVQIRWSASG